MSGITNDIKKLFNLKYKVRNDTITDQYNRILMMKALLVAAFLTGMNWYKNEIKCIMPKVTSGGVGGFASQSCWINGLYIYDDLRHTPNFRGYYGIPNDLTENGTYGDHKTCVVSAEYPDCKPMKKLFFLQYQWFPFYIAIMAFMYHLPYLVFRYVNGDLISLKNDMKKQNPDLDGIIKNYFNRSVNTMTRQKTKIAWNIAIKFLYLIINVCAFTFTDSIFNGEFVDYGKKWFAWSRLSNQEAYNYLHVRTRIKPQEKLLPTFCLCDVLEIGKDIKHQLINKHRFLCEVGQNVLYHYVLVALWILIIIGMIVSCIGIIDKFLEYFSRSMKFAKEETAAKAVFSQLSLREGEYLDFIKKKNVPLYGSLIRKLYYSSSDGSPCKQTLIEKDTTDL